MFDISIWKFLSFHESISWDIFLRLVTFFYWISWNFVSFFILVECVNFFIDMLCISVWKFLSFYESISWDWVFLRFFTFFSWNFWNFISIFIFMECSYLFIDVTSISMLISDCFFISVSWNIYLRLFSIFTWVSWDFFSIFIYKVCTWTNCWSVFSRNIFSCFIFSYNSYTFSSSYVIFFWSECYFTIFIDSISSLSVNNHSSWTIRECWWYI